MGSSSSVVCWRAITATAKASASGLPLLGTLEVIEHRGRSRRAGSGGNVNKDQVEGKVKQGEGKLQELLGDVKEKASDLKEKAEDAFGDAKEKVERAREDRDADRESETDIPPGPGASVITP